MKKNLKKIILMHFQVKSILNRNHYLTFKRIFPRNHKPMTPLTRNRTQQPPLFHILKYL